MSKFYNPGRSSRSMFNPSGSEPFRISRSKIDLFLECPRCFYFDRRLGLGRPPGFPFSLNSAVDGLLKKEFDVHRANGTPHPLMKEYGLDLVPFAHAKMNEWRDALRAGVVFVHKETNLNITGGVDDIWVNKAGELIVVDYKATAKTGEVSLDAEWQIGYKGQVEVYQWLLKQNGFAVSPRSYFVYVNGKMDEPAFNGKLEFTVKLLPYDGDTAWIEPTLFKLKECLVSDDLPKAGSECDYCLYWNEVYKSTAAHGKKKATTKPLAF